MKREGIIISSFIIDRQKQIKLFQVKVPCDVKNIIGIELGLRWLEGVPRTISSAMVGAPMDSIESEGWRIPIALKRNILMGEIKLQSQGKANLFFSDELVLDQNISQADFTSQFFPPTASSHLMMNYETEVKVSGDTTILQGIYWDRLSENIPTNYKYQVFLYVWMEKGAANKK